MTNDSKSWLRVDVLVEWFGLGVLGDAWRPMNGENAISSSVDGGEGGLEIEH